MQHRITIEAFFFNAEKDYLPYYKHFSFRLAEGTPLRDVLQMIAHRHHEFAYPKSRCWLRLNGWVISGAKTVGEIVRQCGTEWRLEPLMERRARHALIIDDSDFDAAFSFVEPWADAGDRAYFQSLYPLHYASETFRFASDYIGDAVLLTAHRILGRSPDIAEELLEALYAPDCGLACAEYENNLFDARDERARFEALRQRLPRPRKAALMDRLAAKLCRKAPREFPGYGLEGGAFALYTGPGCEEEIQRFARALQAKGGRLVNFERSDRLIGRSIAEGAPALARRKAGAMLASAYDAGAQALVFSRDVDLRYIRENFAAIEREMNRELPLPLIAYSEFARRFLGEEAAPIPACP